MFDLGPITVDLHLTIGQANTVIAAMQRTITLGETVDKSLHATTEERNNAVRDANHAKEILIQFGEVPVGVDLDSDPAGQS